jgi:OOP family OmpA-OmpF porin
MFFRQAKFVILIGLSIALSACGQSYREGMSASAVGSVFNYYLTEKYKDLAAAEAAEMDWKDADWFGIRALATAGDNAPEPQALSERHLVEPHLGELAAARDLLIAAFNEGAKDSKPDAAATAQAGFDCWMQEAEENHQPDDIQACKNAFWEGMKKLQERPEETTRGPWIIYFDFDKSDVTSDAQIVIDEAAAAVVKSSVKVLLTGHTDTSGSEKYNMALSERRTKSVAEKLKQAGVSDQQITPSSFGESKPAVATADGVKEAKNRRVEIRLED